MGFVKRLSSVVMVCVGGALLYALVFGPRTVVGISDGLFLAGAILLLIALFPLLSDFFGRRTLPSPKAERSDEGSSEGERPLSQLVESTPFLLGASGIVVIALSFIVGLSVR